MQYKIKGLEKSFTIRRTVQGIGVEQSFLLSILPKILSIKIKQSSKIRRAKLYIRQLRGKSGLTGKPLV